MKRIVILTLTLGLVLAGLAWTLQASAQRRDSKKISWKEVEIGVVPTEYGELVSMAGTTNNYTLVFKAQDGDLRIVEFRGNRINPKALLLRRKY